MAGIVTVPHHTSPIATASVETAVHVLRARGLRVSAARRLVIEALFATERPLTAEQIAAGLEGWLPASDLASVYRNLDTLEQLGVVRHFHAGHGPGLYTLAGPRPCEYLVCDDCGALRPVAYATLDPVRAALRDATGWEARFVHFPIVGTCPACAERSARATRPE
jgi:Fur family transcriptional regulator, ferric uptake regulator